MRLGLVVGVMDFVYVTKPQPADYSELRYSLRSLAEHQNDASVLLVGGVPPWACGLIGVSHVQNQGAAGNVRNALRKACDSISVSDPFVLMNDDFFILGDGLPMLHGGPMANWLRDTERITGATPYTYAGHQTLKILYGLGFERPLSWSLHTPLVVHKGAMRQALDLAASQPQRHIHLRTLYGALCGLSGDRAADCKIKGDNLPGDWPYVSTDDSSFARRPVGRYLRQRFSTPSRWETRDA